MGTSKNCDRATKHLDEFLEVHLSPECQLASCLNPLRNWLALPRFRKVRVPKGKHQQANPSTQDVDGAQVRELKI